MGLRTDLRHDVGGTQEDVRRHNLATMIGHLHATGPLRRAELTALMGRNRSTTAGLVAELAALGAVREERPAGLQARAGRPSLVVVPRSDAVQVVAVDLGVNRAYIALVGLGGSIVASMRIPVRPSEPGVVADAVAGAVASLRRDSRAGERILGIGVAVPGAVRRVDGNVRFAPNLRWEDVPFRDMLMERIPDLPIQIGNDADLGAIAEHRRGVARGVADVVFIAGEEGVGCGLIVGGRPVSGAAGYAGELGHMTVRPGGRPCRCGSRGCWETEIGAEAIARAIWGEERSRRSSSGAGLSTDAVMSALGALSPQRAAALEGVGECLGFGIATVVNLLNPSLVVLGGLLAPLYVTVPAVVLSALTRGALRAPGEQVRITTAALGADAVMIGASELAWADLLDDPALVLAPALNAAL